MSISSEITRLQTQIENCFDAVGDRGGTVPAVHNSANLADAIASIKNVSSASTTPGPVGSISGEINRIIYNLSVAYDVCEASGATMPEDEILENLEDCIRSIPVGPLDNPFRIVAAYEDIDVALKTQQKPRTVAIYYSYDNQTWQTLKDNTPVSVSKNQSLYIKSDGQISNDTSTYRYFVIWKHNSTDFGRADVAGDISCIGTNNSSAFVYLFKNCLIVDASALVLSYDIVYSNMYRYMFRNCTELLYPPELPATRMEASGYGNMFDGCTKMLYAPDIKATNYLGCDRMFYKCESITELPNFAFTGKVPRNALNSMFFGCEGLTSVDFPFTDFDTGAFSNMFQACRSLNSVTVHFTDWEPNDVVAFDHWLGTVSATGDFYCPSDLPIERGDNRIPADWTVHYIN